MRTSSAKTPHFSKCTVSNSASVNRRFVFRHEFTFAALEDAKIRGAEGSRQHEEVFQKALPPSLADFTRQNGVICIKAFHYHLRYLRRHDNIRPLQLAFDETKRSTTAFYCPAVRKKGVLFIFSSAEHRHSGCYNINLFFVTDTIVGI